jgi:pimeloyl-ACP methyl ester carboxylesterase
VGRAAGVHAALPGGRRAGGRRRALIRAVGVPTFDRGTGRPVVLIHGQPGEGSDWEPLTAVLEDEYRVLAPDRPGWGNDGERALGIAGNADWFESLLAERVGDEAVIAVGHSFGGGIALSIALRHPARVRALVLVGSVGHAVALSRLDRLLASPPWGDAIVRVGTLGAKGLVSLTRRALTRIERAAGIIGRAERISMMRVLAGQEPLDGSALRSFSVEQRALVDETAELQRALPTIGVPTVVVAGTHDLVVGPAASRALAASIPGAELHLVAGAGHLLPLEAPARLAALIARYDRLSATT